ncbi:branched-chain amino acid ABC transporter substrate-binding protein [soil metagenome]
MKPSLRKIATALSAASILVAPLASAEHIKIAFIDTVTGTFAPIAENSFNSYQMMADIANQQKWAGDNTIEFVAFDGKGSPQESLRQLKVVIDQGYRYITQGLGSGTALALLDAINKHNERNPGKEIVYFNYGAVDPDLTNYKCSFWHFRFDANTEMKMEGLTSLIAKDQNVKKVYLINQNYAHGHQVSRAAKEFIKRKRPDVELVGDDLHPIGQVKDFSPYIAKIKSSGADTVVTGNWGADLSLLIKASKDAGLPVNFYTFYAFFAGTPTAIGAAGADHVKMVADWHRNTDSPAGNAIGDAFKKKYKTDFVWQSTYSVVAMFSRAVKESKSADPIKVAYALEGMKLKSFSGDAEMRKSDHQLQVPLYVTTWTKVNGKDVKYDSENTSYGWKTDQKIESYAASQPTSCEMKRPAKT